ncbi:cytoplasmic protein [Achromobacter sp. SD115]|uniref:cytoplasmic protein n=1 Tax=Achromobacter sp. SD115 TaxID=2782011 RepID=UPI001A95B232|nr:cytoplasmic protein [Achromobacter sp. SD115]MBO1015820.1 cytoplasmic protein [Achromobacter sp. SD115]
MPVYRLIIKRDGRLIGHFESTAASALDDSRDIAARLPAKDGFQLSLMVADGERRLLESTPQGIRLLAAEHVFVSTPEGLLGGLDRHPSPQ